MMKSSLQCDATRRTHRRDDNYGNKDCRRRRWEEEEEEEVMRTSRRERGCSLDEHCGRKKLRKKRSRESRHRGLTSPCDGSADCNGGDADDGRREELRKRWHARKAKEMG